MTIFFIGWELWQDMTFVLACAIVIVFAIGLVKLWWTNRILRKLEYIDGEKRARLLEIRQCGIDLPRVDQIPFGVRAIRSGVEVEGIWISRPNTPEPSQDASSATLFGQHSGRGTETDDLVRESCIGSRTDGLRQCRSPMDGHYVSSSCESESLANPQALISLPDTPAAPAVDSTPSSRVTMDRPSVSAGSRASLEPNDESTCTWSGEDSEITHIDTARAVRLSPLWTREPVPYGNAEIFANRQVRRPNTNFEVLPAGSLGSRLELADDAIHEVETPRSQFQQLQPERKKLRKSRPDSGTS